MSIKMINVTKFYSRGTQINKTLFSEIEDFLLEKGFNLDHIFNLLTNGISEYVYVSNGFIEGVKNPLNKSNEWHHFFVKDSNGKFVAYKMFFNSEKYTKCQSK